jgi:putative tryptophan/tyrosine transport system permease protein
MELILESLEQSLLFFPLALGIYLSYAILKTTDMTTEGSFVLGAGVFARLITLDFGMIISAIGALFLGGVAGIGVSAIQAKDRINPLIAGIIGLFILYTLNFEIMGRPNIGLHQVMISKTTAYAIILLSAILLLFLVASRFGLMLRAFGSNTTLLKTLGKKVELYRMVGLSISNALAALAGVMTALTVGYADLNMGFGMTLTGIGTVVIGKEILHRFFPGVTYNPIIELIAVFCGVTLYFIAVNGLLSFNINPIYLKFFLGILLIILLRGRKNGSIN